MLLRQHIFGATVERIVVTELCLANKSFAKWQFWTKVSEQCDMRVSVAAIERANATTTDI